MRNMLYYMTENKAVPIMAGDFEREAELQEILANNPNLISRSFDNTPNSSLYLVAKEYEIPVPEGSGGNYSLDHLMVDTFGIPVLVEVKRSSDTRIRREVVAQMIDYACRASTWDIDLMQRFFNDHNPNAPESMCSPEFWETVLANLQQEHFRMVFVADRIPDTLKVMILFLDRTMKDIEVYGVELCPYRSGEKLLLSADFIGNPIPDEKKASSTRSDVRIVSSVDDFLDLVLSIDGKDSVSFITDLLAFSSDLGLTSVVGRGDKLATLSIKKDGMTVFGISQHQAGGEFMIEFYKQFVNNIPNSNVSFDSVLSAMKELCITGLIGDFRQTDFGIYIPVSNLFNPSALCSLKEIIRSLV